MRIYTIHRRADRIALVPDGLSFWGLVFGPLWLLWHRAYVPGLALLVVAILIEGIGRRPDGTDTALGDALSLALSTAIALFGNDLRRLELRLAGYAATTGTVAGGTLDQALLRALDRDTLRAPERDTLRAPERDTLRAPERDALPAGGPA